MTYMNMKWPKCDIALVPQLAAGLAGSSATLADQHVLLYSLLGSRARVGGGEKRKGGRRFSF